VPPFQHSPQVDTSTFRGMTQGRVAEKNDPDGQRPWSEAKKFRGHMQCENKGGRKAGVLPSGAPPLSFNREMCVHFVSAFSALWTHYASEWLRIKNRENLQNCGYLLENT